MGNCDWNVSSEDEEEKITDTIIALAVASSVSLVANILTIIVAIYYRVYKSFPHRLALYLVCSSVFTNIMYLLHSRFLSIGKIETICTCNKALELLTQYLMTVELLFAVCVIFHLFSLAVLQRDYKNWEHIYLCVSMFLPLFLVVLCISLTLDDDAYSGIIPWCEINISMDKSTLSITAEGITWYAPLVIFQIFNVIAMLSISVTLCRRSCPSTTGDGELAINISSKHQRALKELSPLLVYVAIFFLLTLIPIINRGIMFDKCKYKHTLAMVHVISNGLWGFVCSVGQLVHIAINKRVRKGWLSCSASRRSISFRSNYEAAEYTGFTEVVTTAGTDFNQPMESETDRLIPQ